MPDEFEQQAISRARREITDTVKLWREHGWGYPPSIALPDIPNITTTERHTGTYPPAPEPNERPAARELNALWEDITRIREELRKMREDIRGLTQAVVNYRKEASLARGGGGAGKGKTVFTHKE